MDRRTLLGRLAKAEKHTAGGMERITRQQAIIAKLQAERRESQQAFVLLNAYRKVQALSEANVERLRKEMGSAK